MKTIKIKNKGILKFSLIFMYFWMIVDSWQTLNFTWSYCTRLVLSLHHMWLFKQVEQHLIWSTVPVPLMRLLGAIPLLTVVLRFSKHLLPVSGVFSLWSSNSLLQTCTSLATTVGSAVSEHRCRIWCWANCCSGSRFELRGLFIWETAVLLLWPGKVFNASDSCRITMLL